MKNPKYLVRPSDFSVFVYSSEKKCYITYQDLKNNYSFMGMDHFQYKL